MIFGVERSYMLGDRLRLSPISWRSWKLHRTARSSLSAESQALSDTIDEIQACRVLLLELTYGPVNLRYAKGNLDEYLKEIPAAIVTDAKCIYDAMRNESSNLGMRERDPQALS